MSRGARTSQHGDCWAVPGLDALWQGVLRSDIQDQTELPPRLQALVTVAALIAGNHAHQMPDGFAQALDDGLRPAELSESVLHLAFYCGFPCARTATHALADLYAARGISPDQLPEVAPALMPADEAIEAVRQAGVAQSFGQLAPGVVAHTDMLFRTVWHRPGLDRLDRCILTVSALVATGHTAQLAFHLPRAMDAGLGPEQISVMLIQLAYLSGWPKVFSAMPVIRQILNDRTT